MSIAERVPGSRVVTVKRHHVADEAECTTDLLIEELPAALVFLTSRASHELAYRAARCQIPILATMSAPSALARTIAQRAGIRLLSFCRRNSTTNRPGVMYVRR